MKKLLFVLSAAALLTGCDAQRGTGGTGDDETKTGSGAVYDRGGQNDATSDQGLKGRNTALGSESNRITTGPVTSANTGKSAGGTASEPAGNTTGNASGLTPNASTNAPR